MAEHEPRVRAAVIPFVQDADFTLYVGDALEVLREMPDESVHCCVTSPPYWGLRDYGTAGQIGLEATPDEFVEAIVLVFLEVRRVLRADGTCWLNLGDSYAGGGRARGKDREATYGESKQGTNAGTNFLDAAPVPLGLKPKDLVGIPWSVVKALQEPYYTGRIAAERDRVWLAATIDAEGSICGFTHERADGDGTRTGVHITITNTSMPLLAEAQRIWPTSRDDGNAHGPSALGSRECRRWIAHNVDDKAALLCELYPYLIAKKQQAVLAWNFLEMSRAAKRIGKTAEGARAKEQRAWIVSALSDLNHGRAVDLPAWIAEPPTLYEDGWYLRSDIIWSKPNPMPESVTDRPTKAHEYVFLLSKSPRYFFDQEAVREPAEWARWGDQTNAKHEGSGSAAGWIGNKSKAQLQGGRQARRYDAEHFKTTDERNTRYQGPNPVDGGRNLRSVWEIATQPYPQAHFATFPEALPERCIKAGTSERGCCPECGAPWVRETESELVPTAKAAKTFVVDARDHSADANDQGANRQKDGHKPGWINNVTTTGWAPSCGHDLEPVPATVLDCFVGSGTTALVARKLGRRSIGIELSSEYAALAADRLKQLSLFALEAS